VKKKSIYIDLIDDRKILKARVNLIDWEKGLIKGFLKPIKVK